jgi:hypothetical protein
MRQYGNILIFVLFISLLFPLAAVAVTDNVHIVASRDNTLIEDPQGSISNGSGPFLFAGRTNQSANSIRRGVIHFDMAATVPPGARIRSVRLILFLAKGNNAVSEVSVHKLLEDWGEGVSFATGGKGAPAEPGDATWLHTFYPDFSWLTAGGEFVPEPSAIREVGPAVRSYTWESTKELVRDVESWMENPESNFGWILIGDETDLQTVQVFSSREPRCDAAFSELPPPLLEVTYSIPGKGQ